MVPTPSRSAAIALISPSRWRDTSIFTGYSGLRALVASRCWPCQNAMIIGMSASARSNASGGSIVRRVVLSTKRMYSAATTPSVTWTQRCRPMRRQRFMPCSVLWRGFGIEQPVQMYDEIAHLGIVDAALRFRPPGGVSGGVVRIHADDIDFAKVLELHVRHARQFPAKNEMKQLLGLLLGIRHDA